MTARRMIRTSRRAPNRNARFGQCGWADDDGCDFVGSLRPNGLCLPHYDKLRQRLTQEGLTQVHRIEPHHCTCMTPSPKQCAIIGGRVLVPGAFECSTCGRHVPNILLADADPTPAHGIERPLVVTA